MVAILVMGGVLLVGGAVVGVIYFGTVCPPPWRQPRGNLLVCLVNSHTNATRMGWHLWEIDFRFAPWPPAGWLLRGPFWGDSRLGDVVYFGTVLGL